MKSQEMVPRKYFSGGMDVRTISRILKRDDAMLTDPVGSARVVEAEVEIIRGQPEGERIIRELGDRIVTDMQPPGSSLPNAISEAPNGAVETADFRGTGVDLVGFMPSAQPQLSTTASLYVLSGNLKNNFGRDVRVRLHDMYADHSLSMDQIVADVVKNKPKVLGVSLAIGTLDQAQEFIQKLRDQMQDNMPLIVWGGSLATFISDKLAKDLFPGSIVVRGEGEYALNGIVDYLINGKGKLEDIPNLAFVQDGKYVVTKRESREMDQSAPMDLEEMVKAHKKTGAMVRLEASRGCQFSGCLFCAVRDHLGSRTLSLKWRTRGVQSILRDISYLMDQDVEVFHFVDEEFFNEADINDMDRVKSLAQGIIALSEEKQKRIRFTISARADAIFNDDEGPDQLAIRKDSLQLLKEAGLYKVFVGIENGSQSQLDRFMKGLSINESVQAVRILREIGIGLEVGFILFDPEVTLDEIEESMRFIEENDLLKDISWVFNVLKVTEGTPFARKYRNMPAVKLSAQANPNTLQYDYEFLDPSVTRLITNLGIYIEDSIRVFYILKSMVRQGILPEMSKDEYAIYEKYLQILRQKSLDAFKGFLALEKKFKQDGQEPQYATVLKERISEQVALVDALELELSVQGQGVVREEVQNVLGFFREKAGGRLSKMKEDKAIIAQEIKSLGGIDLNLNPMNIEVQGDYKISFNVSLNDYLLQSDSIQGAYPVIINIIPANKAYSLESLVQRK